MQQTANILPDLSRRALLRHSGILGASAALSALPMGQLALAREASNWPSVAALINSYVSEGRVANMVAALGWRVDEPEYLAQGNTSFGNDISVGPDTLYRIYSMTKPITGMATMLCIQDGLLELDTPIAEIIPAFANMKVQIEPDGAITEDNLRDAERQITVRHCLTHTAGLAYSIVQQGPIAQAFAEKGLVPGQATKLPIPGIFRAPAVPSLELFAERLATMPLVYEPGERWSYSVGLDLLGRVIEVVSGKPFDEFMTERILAPCGMSSTSFRVAEEDIGRFTGNYASVDGELVPIDPPADSVYLDEPAFPFGGAGLVSSARDYDRFLMMLANGGVIDGTRVMDEETVRVATSDIMPDTLATDGGFSLGPIPMGFGAGGLVGQGMAEGLFGWFGAASTGGLVNLRMGLRQTLMTQLMAAGQTSLMSEFPAAATTDALAQMFGS